MLRMKNTLYFIVLILCFSCDDIVGVTDISEELVSVIAPSNRVVLNDRQVRFTWTDIDEAESYHLQIASPNFIAAQQVLVDSVMTHLNFSTSLDLGDYEWRIRAENSGYITEYATQSFRIEE